jgi:hypothetical protein
MLEGAVGLRRPPLPAHYAGSPIGDEKGAGTLALGESTPPGFEAFDASREAIVKPVVDKQATSEVPDETAMPRRARSKRTIDASAWLAQPDSSNRVTEDDEAVLGRRLVLLIRGTRRRVATPVE